ncbi:hypothetical protein NDU88_001110 [Pleurodeles waltl]|uniref:Uncharacterized protein n=1 Tax=Pleurodeles waltl TaxID=8319 RepID=A0AAV7P2X4_PLEWA|nr:hypothetical protein NDU88_001110 [Pleurodeles waltl]
MFGSPRRTQARITCACTEERADISRKVRKSAEQGARREPRRLRRSGKEERGHGGVGELETERGQRGGGKDNGAQSRGRTAGTSREVRDHLRSRFTPVLRRVGIAAGLGRKRSGRKVAGRPGAHESQR